MKHPFPALRLPGFVLLLLLAGCSQKAVETQTEAVADSTGVMHDSTTTESTPVPEPVIEIKEEKPEFNAASISRFRFLTKEISEFEFSDDGKVKWWKVIDGEEQELGTWSIEGNFLKIMTESNLVILEVLLFNEGLLRVRTTSEYGGQLFGESDTDGMYYIALHRLIYAKPYEESQFYGGWQVDEGGCSFDNGGAFNFGAADCNVSGTWSFEGGYIGIDLKDIQCGWSKPFDTNLEIKRLAPGLMITLNNEEIFAVFNRDH